MADHQDDIGKIIEMAQRKETQRKEQEANEAADKLDARLKPDCMARLAFAFLNVAISSAVVGLTRKGVDITISMSDFHVEVRGPSRKARLRLHMSHGYNSNFEIEVINAGPALGEVRSYVRPLQDVDYAKLDEWAQKIVAQVLGYVTEQHQYVMLLY